MQFLRLAFFRIGNCTTPYVSFCFERCIMELELET